MQLIRTKEELRQYGDWRKQWIFKEITAFESRFPSHRTALSAGALVSPFHRKTTTWCLQLNRVAR
jgi:hypothetical protein